MIEFRYKPWKHQRQVIRQLDEGCKRILLVWHRRAGKDLTAFNGIIRKALKKVGSYYYFFPTLKLGKKILWDGMDKEGIRYRDYIPSELIKKTSESDLKITLVNGSIIQVMSVEDVSRSAIGTNALGVVFSEYAAYSTGEAWDLVRPILAANDGFAVFAYTPRGHNHGYKLYEDALGQPEWFTSKLSVEETSKPDGTPIVTTDIIDADRRSGMPEELVQQEYYCSFEGFSQGGFFSDQFQFAKSENRITLVPWTPHQPVETVCDIGVGLNFAAWFYQKFRSSINVINYYESPNGSITDFANYVKALPYFYSKHFAPWDANKPNEDAGVRRVDTAFSLGLNWIVLPKLSVEERINAGRLIFSQCNFDAKNCKEGLVHLQNYRRKWNEKLGQYENRELHDRHSHGGSAFSYLGVACRDKLITTPRLTEKAEMNFNPFKKNDLDTTKRSVPQIDSLWGNGSSIFSTAR